MLFNSLIACWAWQFAWVKTIYIIMLDSFWLPFGNSFYKCAIENKLQYGILHISTLVNFEAYCNFMHIVSFVQNLHAVSYK